MLYLCWFCCDVVQSLEFNPLILSRLDTSAWFGGSEARDVLEVGALEENLYLQRSFNLQGWSISEVMKLELWKKTCIFKEASIFKDGRFQKLLSHLALGIILSELSEVKIFQLFQMRRTHLFIEFTFGLYGLEPSWSMD